MVETLSRESNFERRLQDFLLYPRESLSTEIKGWIDPSNENDKANLAQAMIALANSGGGYIIIGFTENGGNWIPSKPRPENLNIFNQDIVNGILQRYAEPPFHCEVYHQKHPQTNEIYPIIIVPGENKVPIRAKRDGPNREHVQQLSYYIRRPGPKSEPPQSGQDWDELIGRCIRASRDELIKNIRGILMGFDVSTQIPDPEEQQSKKFEKWVQDSRNRFETLVTEKLPNEKPSRYAYGTWTATYSIEAEIKPQSLGTFLSILRSVQGHETGWPVWWVPDSERLAPYPLNGTIECWLVNSSWGNASDSDYWRASPLGSMFLLRGYQEDEDPKFAGTFLDLTIPVWRVGECLLHAERLTKALHIDSAPILFQVQWGGLVNRQLKAWANKRRMMWGDYTSRQTSILSNIKVQSDQISTNLPDIVKNLTKPLYEAFNFFEPPLEMIEQELIEMRGKSKFFA
jgi:hypothetical protein